MKTPEQEPIDFELAYGEIYKDQRAALAEALAQPSDSVEQEPLEYWNAVEGWVKIDEVRQHFETVSCGTIYKNAGEGRVPLYTAPPKRELKSTTDMMMELADRLGELPDDVDPRAWEHLLVYAPKQKPVMEYDKEELRGTFWDTTPPKRKEWVGLSHEDVKVMVNLYRLDPLNTAFQIEAKLKELNT